MDFWPRYRKEEVNYKKGGGCNMFKKFDFTGCDEVKIRDNSLLPFAMGGDVLLVKKFDKNTPAKSGDFVLVSSQRNQGEVKRLCEDVDAGIRYLLGVTLADREVPIRASQRMLSSAQRIVAVVKTL
jgi:hypothetical protein